jgi:pyruvate dehydrogenase E1 component
MSANPIAVAANDPDAVETQEWLDALDTVIEREGPERAHYLLDRLIEQARRSGADIPLSASTAYVNTIPPHLEEHSPGDPALEERIRSYARWNAMAMVVRANRGEGDLGGHIASYASVGTLMEVGFNQFWRAPNAEHGGDLIYIQGHSSPGVYARAFLEGRISEDQLINFRREVDGKGVSSYPHPKLMPDFWQFPTVSMGLGPIQGIYQARFLKYLHARGIAETEKRKVWVFCGDGEMDEPESLGAIGMAAREKLDNLIFVVNCNLQRLDGPVRGNGKIIQELEGVFRGAGWNVIKVIWGSYWDPLLARDTDGLLRQVMEETVDGEYQNYKAKDGAYVRKHFFGKRPQLLERVSRMTDEDIWRLNRGGHDPHKIYAAYAAASRHAGQPTVILAKTVKGYGMGKIGEAKNPTHQLKKLDTEAVREFRDRFRIPIPDDKLEELPFYRPDENAPEMKYLHDRRRALGGYLPQRRRRADETLKAPPLETFSALLEPTSEGREISSPRGADHSGRGAHVRHGRHVPAARDLFAAGPAVRAGRPRPGDVLPRGQGRADSGRGHQRGRCDELLDGRRDQLLEQQPDHGAVLHLLFDVRIPAGRRPRVGRRRHAGEGIPAGRNQRAHHAERRGPAAPGRALAHPGLDDSERRVLRPHVRIRGGGDPA